MDQCAKVLIIDDDADYRNSVRAYLESEGFEVTEAADGRLGLDLALSARPDLIILDVMMESPVEGYAVKQAIKFQAKYAELRDTRIIMVSAIGADPHARFPMSPEADMISPDYYVTKPVDFDQLGTMVQRLVHHTPHA